MITCLHKYWLKQFFKFFVIIQLLILTLFVLIDYLSRLDSFLKSDLTLIGALGYVLLKVPYMSAQLTPAGILLSAITVFALMNRNNELLAIRSSGISVYFLIKPAVGAGVFLMILIFFLGETLIPVTMAKSNYIRYNIIKKGGNKTIGKKDIWIKSGNRLIHINYFDPVNQTVAGVSISTLGKDFLLESRLDAQKGRYREGKWILEQIIEQHHVKDKLDYDVVTIAQKEVELDLEPDDLGEIAKKSDEMSYSELKRYVKKVEDEGYDATKYKTDMNAKLAFPFICIIMALAGAATGMKRFAKNNIPAAVGAGVVIAFFYWFFYAFCVSLGYGSILPPIVAAWAANLVFLCGGILYLAYTE